MLQQRVEEWEQGWKQEGRQEGRQEGEAIVLLELLQCKFGKVPAHYRTKIEAADSAQLLDWTRQVLKISNLEQLFEAPKH